MDEAEWGPGDAGEAEQRETWRPGEGTAPGGAAVQARRRGGRRRRLRRHGCCYRDKREMRGRGQERQEKEGKQGARGWPGPTTEQGGGEVLRQWRGLRRRGGARGMRPSAPARASGRRTAGARGSREGAGVGEAGCERRRDGGRSKREELLSIPDRASMELSVGAAGLSGGFDRRS